MKIVAHLIAVLIVATPTWTSAQMTICQGDVCTEENNGTKRTLSTEEAAKLQRSNSRTAIGNIQCRYATDEAACGKKLGEIFALFPW